MSKVLDWFIYEVLLGPFTAYCENCDRTFIVTKEMRRKYKITKVYSEKLICEKCGARAYPVSQQY